MEAPSESVGLARPARLAVGYTAMLVIAAALIALITWYGGGLEAPVLETAVTTATHAGPSAHMLPRVLFALVAVIGLGRMLSLLLAKLDQPPVIGEVLAGILLGPSLIGAETSAMILPAAAAPYLGVLAQLGVILYMFVIGLELNAGQLASRAHATVAISHASIVLPFLLGTLLALWLYPRLSHAGVSFTGFAMFCGVSMAVTAFPVLARILSDRGITRTELGGIALACAAADDVTAWCLLAFVVGIVNASVAGATVTLGLAAAYLALMYLVVRPLAIMYLGGRPAPLGASNPSAEPSSGLITAVLLAVLVSALTTELIGIHAIFGAFLLGAIIPHDAPIAKVFTEKMGPMAMTLLLPAFFAYTGMRTEIGLVSGAEAWVMVAVIIAVATLGKFGGTYVAARFAGLDSKMSAALGILMNTRGLMELIVLNIGLDLGVISPKLFAMLVLMALVTTIATTPILKRIMPELSASAA
ncbi:MAG TPA: cation:proton antiporter [Planctomycetaceae bacterium]|nr:cation:proton antiporter [Planctomycetaceae bacterium]